MINARVKNHKIKLKPLKRALISLFFFLVLIQAPAFCETNSSNAFNLITVVDNFLNLDSVSKSTYDTLDEKTRQKKVFIETTKKFNQGNVSVAYNDYANIISETDNDFALFVASKTMYEMGFFTLGDVAISKIKNQTFFQKQIEILKKTYCGGFSLDKQEEIFLAKAYTSIHFDNIPEEIAFDLSKKSNLLEKSDYANYIMAQALLESRQYQQALMFIDNAIEKNSEKIEYLSYKIEILMRSKKFKEAMKILEQNENSNNLTPEFKIKLHIQKENILAALSGDENEKKFHLISALYLEGNYFKVINECQNILNFNKNNYKILALQAQSQLNTGKISLAKKNFQTAYELNKNYSPVLMGLGDIEFIEENSKKAFEYYKQAQKFDKNNPLLLIKLLIASKEISGNEKITEKLQNQIDKNLKNPFYEYYLVATGMFRNNQQLKREYLMKSLALNPLFNNSLQEYFAYLTEINKQKPLQNLLYMVSFVREFNYAYYYYTGIVENNLGSKEEALLNIKHSLVLNPDFEPAIRLLADLSSKTI